MDCPWDERCETDADTSGHESSSMEPEQDWSCGICFETFRINDIVSCSSTSECDHVYHRDCIDSWLLRHEDCPICRRRYLLVDYTRQAIPTKTLKSLRKQYRRRRRSTYFCIQEGLITLDRLSEKDTPRVDKAKCDGLRQAAAENSQNLSIAKPLTVSVDLGGEYSGSHQEELVLPFRRLPVSSDSNDSVVTSRLSSCGTDGDTQYSKTTPYYEEDRIIHTKESTETVSTTASSALSQM